MAENNRTSIYLSPQLADEKRKWADAAFGGFSRRLTSILERLEFIVSDAIPDFNRPEWCAIFDALNGYWMEGRLGITGIPLQLSDAINMDGLDEKWGFDGKAFLKKLNALSSAGLVAVAEVSDEFWLNTERDIDEFIANIQARKAQCRGFR